MIDYWVNKLTENQYNKLLLSLGIDIINFFYEWKMVYKDVDGKGIIRIKVLINSSKWLNLSQTKKDNIKNKFGMNIKTWYFNNRVRLSTIKFPKN